MRRYTIEAGGKEYVIDVKETGRDSFRVSIGDQTFAVRLTAEQDLAEAVIRPEIVPAQGGGAAIQYAPPPPETMRQLPEIEQPHLPDHDSVVSEDLRRDVAAPMPGTVLSVDVRPGEQVGRGQQLFVLEAMKMKNPIRAPRGGIVEEVFVQAGQSVTFNEPLLHFQESADG